IKKKVAEWTGVVPILSHMCPNTCMAYTGPFSDRQSCTFCGTPRYDPVTGAAREFYTMPLGPQLQALYRTPESATFGACNSADSSHGSNQSKPTFNQSVE
ncbi:hypothetical protein R3P38DRAFT_2579503, partial [Favolaschia claudopus]